jgi:phosphohistidine phosphatase
MGRLFLLRHAKAAWAQPGMRDFDRPLDSVGRADADRLGAEMKARGYLPQRVLCSPALRARQTWEGVANHLQVEAEAVAFEERLYSSDATGYLASIRHTGGAASLLVVGHNPMVEDVALALAGDGRSNGRRSVPSGFPTCGLAVIDFPAGFSEAAPGAGKLLDFLVPPAR